MTHATGNSQDHVQVLIRADISSLTPADRQVLELLVEATKFINPVYLMQARQQSRKDGFFNKAEGYNFYPKGMTQQEIEKYLDEHPDQRTDILSPFTVVERSAGRLVAIPYSKYYEAYFGEISECLKRAAAITENESFGRFLRSRAEAFRSNQYRQSDIDWVHVEGSPLELTIGPFENYEDELFGIKRDVEGILGVVLPYETAEAQVYQEQVVQFDSHLGARYGYTAATTQTPMVVIDEILASGHTWYGYVPMAYNLPNDPDIQEEVGSKKVFVRNVMHAKVELITRQIAQRTLEPGLADLLDSSVFMRFVIGHESSHGLSFRFGGEHFLTLSSPLEEGKADVFGMIFLFFLAEKGIIEDDVAERAVIGNLTDGLRQIRFGMEEAHAVGTLIQYNWFLEHGALRFDKHGLKFEPKRFKQVLEDLGDEFYSLSKTRSLIAAQQFVNSWGSVPVEVRHIIASFDGIPVDIDPIFEV